MTGPETTGRTEANHLLLGFVRAVREAGVAVSTDRSATFLAAVALLGVRRTGVRQAAEATLCRGPADVVVVNRVIELYFRADLRLAPGASADPSPDQVTAPLTEGEALGGDEEQADLVAALASDREILRHRDFASLSPPERDRLDRLFATLDVRPPRRTGARRSSSQRGEVDAARTARASLRQMGEPVTLARRARSPRERRVVLLVDVSGSMSGYAGATLRLAHRMTRELPGLVDTFLLGTRLTRVTRHLRVTDPDRALSAIAGEARDWSGGTRLGDGLETFLELWGRPRLARGAVVVIFSDGWEQGSTDHLAEQARRLRLLAHRVLWVNPHRGKPGYEPVQAGVRAVLPHIDGLLAGHSLATFSDLLDEVARVRR